jgi:hypothetical protein
VALDVLARPYQSAAELTVGQEMSVVATWAIDSGFNGTTVLF